MTAIEYDAELAARVTRLTAWGYPARIVGPAEAARLEPALRIPAPGAFFLREGYLLTEPLIGSAASGGLTTTARREGDTRGTCCGTESARRARATVA